MTSTSLHEVPPIVDAVRRFVDKDVAPTVSALEHADSYPHELVARMKELGLFGSLVPREYGGLGLDVTTYARVIEEICRGFMSLAGVINSHTMAALIVLEHGTEEQRARFLPRFARGEARGGLCLTEPHAGSDVQAIRTVARRDGDRYLISGSKMFVTNGREGNTFALLARTDPSASPAHRGMSCFIVEKGEPGFEVVKSIGKLGYKGVDTAELLFDRVPVPASNLVGGVEGRGFKQVMSGLETGRINIAARAVGVAQATLDDTVRHLAREGSGPPSDSRRIVARLAITDMATRLTGARLLTYWAAGMKDAGQRCDLEAGMAKLCASETAQELAAQAVRILGEDGCATRHAIERHYRDAPLMIIGEGTNEIQRLIICRNLLERYGERLGALTSLSSEPAERRQMVLAVRQLVEREVIPRASAPGRGREYPIAALDGLGELGLFGATIPQDHGGLGLDTLTSTLIVEEVARGSMTLAALLESHLTVADLVMQAGTAAQRQRLLPAMALGRRRAGRVRADGTPGTSVAGGGIHARADGDHFVLDGRGRILAHARHGHLFAVLADEAGEMRCFLVEAGQPGLELVEEFHAVGQQGIESWHIALDHCRVASGNLVGGQAGSVAPAIERALTRARIRAAGAAVGLAQAALEAALRYSQQRVAFGVPICQHQAIQLKLADMATQVTVARLLVAHAARDGEHEGMYARMAQGYAAETAYQVTLESMRIHGGYGYTTEFPVERYYRDAAILLAGEAGEEAGRLETARRWIETTTTRTGATP